MTTAFHFPVRSAAAVSVATVAARNATKKPIGRILLEFIDGLNTRRADYRQVIEADAAIVWIDRHAESATVGGFTSRKREKVRFMEQNEKLPVSGQDSRRDFIKKTATAAAAVAATGILKAPVYGQNQAPSANVKG